MSMFLDADEMADLTGYKQASKQIAQLKLQKIPFHINAAGHPKVARAGRDMQTLKQRLISHILTIKESDEDYARWALKNYETMFPELELIKGVREKLAFHGHQALITTGDGQKME